MNQTEVRPAEGRLGILVVGCGAVATTFMTGVLMARKGLAKPIGSMTQYDRIRVGSGDSCQYLKYEDIVPLASLSDLVFGCWDVYPQNAYQAARYAEVLKEKDIDPVREELEQIVPMRAAGSLRSQLRQAPHGGPCEDRTFPLADGRGAA